MFILALSALLVIGIKETATSNNAFVVIKIGALVVFVIAGLALFHPANLVPFAPLGFGTIAFGANGNGIVPAAALVFFSYIGFDTATTTAEETRNPARDVPVGVLGSLAIGTVIYCTVAVVLVGIVPWQHVDQNAALLAAVAPLKNPIVDAIITIGVIAGTTSVALTSLLGQSRIFYVMARDRMLPPAVAAVHPRFKTPARMTIVTGIIVAALAFVVPLDALLELVNIGTFSAFIIVCAGVIWLRYKRPDLPRPFRSPLRAVLSAVRNRAVGVPLDRRSGPVYLAALHRLAAGGSRDLLQLRISPAGSRHGRERPMIASLDVAATPASATGRAPAATVVVIDVLRATSSIVTALDNGAAGVVPVREPEEAVAVMRRFGRDRSLLCGERDSRLIAGFDLDNSPASFARERVAGKTLVLTTTNGTRALVEAARGNAVVYCAALLNRAAIAERLAAGEGAALLLCAGSHGTPSLEDLLCAGAIADALLHQHKKLPLTDAARAAATLYAAGAKKLTTAIAMGTHALDLVAKGFAADVAACARLDVSRGVPRYADGVITSS